MSIKIIPATLRDASYVMANLRPLDRIETYCQIRDGLKDYEVAYWLLMNSDAYAARWTDSKGVEWPVMFFGVQPMNQVAVSVWALGTRHAWRAVPAVTRFFIERLLPLKIEQGNVLMEARSIVDHKPAHRWMESTGAKRIGEPFIYGKGGEQFILFRWKAEDLQNVR